MWLDLKLNGCRPNELAIRLRILRRLALDSKVSTRPVRDRRMRAEVLSQQAPRNGQRLPAARRREDAQVQLAVISRDPGAEDDQIVEDGAEVRHHHGRRASLEGFTVNSSADAKGGVAQRRTKRDVRIREDAEPAFPDRGRVANHASIHANAPREGEAAARRESPQVDVGNVTVQKGRGGAACSDRDAQRSRDQIPGPAWQNPNGNARARECADNLHRGAIAAECEHSLILGGALSDDLGGVTWPFRRGQIDVRAVRA